MTPVWNEDFFGNVGISSPQNRMSKFLPAVAELWRSLAMETLSQISTSKARERHQVSRADQLTASVVGLVFFDK